MSAKLAHVVSYLDELLKPPPACQDASNNGLQVDGGAADVTRVVFGVDASLALFAAAQKRGAQLVVVHHGLSWRDQFKRLRGLTARRLETLFTNGISLYASHLPLDAHPEVGHNAQLAQMLKLADSAPFFEYGNIPIGRLGTLPQPLTPAKLAAQVNQLLGTECVLYPGRAKTIKKIGIVSGGGGDCAEAAAELGCDAILTGEITHAHWHLLKETGITGIAAGHYATETPGLKAVMQRLQRDRKVACEWVDLPTGL